MYTIWKVGDDEYKLRLNTLQTIQTEKMLGMGIPAALGHLSDMSVMVAILFNAMQPLNHGINQKNVCDILDKYLDEGGDLSDLTDILIELLAQAGYGDRKTQSTKNGTSQNAAEQPTNG